ncbi:MAG: hypothetical protein JXR76_24000 [Deltaproteobacteria bacterium]|nr:hypothetical protein [Deltaproteobacteria bacterium]
MNEVECRVSGNFYGWAVLLIAIVFFTFGCGGDDGAADESDGDDDSSDDSESDVESTDDSGGDSMNDDSEKEDSDASDSDTNDADSGAPLCEDDQRVGRFILFAKAADTGRYTSLNGSVSDSVSPTAVPEILKEEGDCALIGPRKLFCDTTCESGETCGLEGTCVPSPVKKSVGTVTVTGLDQELSVEPKPIIVSYSEKIDDPFPAFEEGATVEVSAAGDEIDGFSLSAKGVSLITADGMSEVVIESGASVPLSWDASGDSTGDEYVHVELVVNTHGATAGWIECNVADTGSAEIPESLITALMELGLSGFPSLVIQRLSTDSTTVDEGCVDLKVYSEAEITVTIPGLQSCNSDDDCDDGETCQPDLQCG